MAYKKALIKITDYGQDKELLVGTEEECLAKLNEIWKGIYGFYPWQKKEIEESISRLSSSFRCFGVKEKIENNQFTNTMYQVSEWYSSTRYTTFKDTYKIIKKRK